MKITKDNFGKLLIESAKQALDHSKGLLKLKETKVKIPDGTTVGCNSCGEDNPCKTNWCPWKKKKDSQ